MPQTSGNPGSEKAMILLTKLVVGAVGTIVTLGAMVCSEGFVSVRVQEKHPGGTHISIFAPALLLNGGLRCVPSEHLRDAGEQIRPWMPTIEAAMQQMGKMPDLTLVGVTDPSEHVQVSKLGGSIVVDVDDENETVHVSAPLRAMDDAVQQIAAAGPKL